MVVSLCMYFYSQELKHCSVLLNRLHTDDKALKKELDSKEDMNRKGVKPCSRIPTFHKRPISTSLTTELPVPKQDTPVHVTQPPEKAASGSVEASKSNPTDVRETALPLPSVHSPKTISHSPFVPGSMEQDAAAPHRYLNAASRGWSLPETGCSLMTASPRSALRTKEDTSSTLESEASTPDSPESSPTHESSLSQKPLEQNRFMLTSSGDMEIDDITEISQVAAIMDEEPPWEMELMKTAEQKDSTSSSGADSEEDLGSEKSESGNSGHHEPLTKQPEFCENNKYNKSNSPVAPDEPAKLTSTKLTKVSYV